MKHRLNHEDRHQLLQSAPRVPHRALALGGGGPAVGISIGFLRALDVWNQQMDDKPANHHRKIDFPVWVAGCVGAWLSCLYHLGQGHNKGHQVGEVMRKFFRPEAEYDLFPCPTTFTPDLPELLASSLKFMLDPASYKNLVVPQSIIRAHHDLFDFYLRPSRWNPGDFANLMLNSVFAPNPASRLIMGLQYKAPLTGLNKLWFGPEYSVLQQYELSRLSELKTQLYFNSYNLSQHQQDIYSNHPGQPLAEGRFTQPITMPALCAASALPYVMQPLELQGRLHMEGAVIDSFCLENVQDLHPELNEIWISRIVDHEQVQPPRHLLDALNNLIMLYAGTTSLNDVRRFADRHHQEEVLYALNEAQQGRSGHQPHWIEVIELPVWSGAQYYWTHENFDACIQASEQACMQSLRDYDARVSRNRQGQALRAPLAQHIVRTTA